MLNDERVLIKEQVFSVMSTWRFIRLRYLGRRLSIPGLFSGSTSHEVNLLSRAKQKHHMNLTRLFFLVLFDVKGTMVN